MCLYESDAFTIILKSPLDRGGWKRSKKHGSYLFTLDPDLAL